MTRIVEIADGVYLEIDRPMIRRVENGRTTFYRMGNVTIEGWKWFEEGSWDIVDMPEGGE
jgi:hypothetical protein